MQSTRGFSLIELSVVIVIIGLLAAGIFVGQSLLQSARLREVIRDYDMYVKAVKEFQDKYQALPGDMNNAESIWGSDSSCPTTATNTVPKVATCNGDGNGTIGSSNTSGGVSTVYSYEWFRAWQQLSNAGLILGKYTGVKGSGSNLDADIAVNVPIAKMDKKFGWTLHYYLLPVTTTAMWGDQYGHIFAFGGDTTDITRTVALKAADASYIDEKMDDGKPGRGIVRARRTASEASCTTNDTTQDGATYNTTYAPIACAPIFLGGF